MDKTEAPEEKTDKEKMLIIAKDLVDLSNLTRKILANSTFNYDILEDVKLAELMTREIIGMYTVAPAPEKGEKNE